MRKRKIDPIDPIDLINDQFCNLQERLRATDDPFVRKTLHKRLQNIHGVRRFLLSSQPTPTRNTQMLNTP